MSAADEAGSGRTLSRRGFMKGAAALAGAAPALAWAEA